VTRDRGQIASVKADRAARRRQVAHQRTHQAGLAGAIAPDQADHASRIDLERQAAQHLDRADGNVNGIDLQHCRLDAPFW